MTSEATLAELERLYELWAKYPHSIEKDLDFTQALTDAFGSLIADSRALAVARVASGTLAMQCDQLQRHFDVLREKLGPLLKAVAASELPIWAIHHEIAGTLSPADSAECLKLLEGEMILDDQSPRKENIGTRERQLPHP